MIFALLIFLIAVDSAKSSLKVSAKKKKLNGFTMAKTFFASMVDPTIGQTDALGRSPTETLKKKSDSQFGVGFSSPASNTFGSVCGPNGCT